MRHEPQRHHAPAPRRESGADDGGQTASVVALRPILAQLQRSGVDPARILAALHLSARDIDDPERRISERSRLRAWRLAAELSGDECFGLSVAVHVELGAYDVLDYAVCWSSNVEDALSRIARFHRLLYDAARVDVSRQGDEMIVRRAVAPSATYRHECEALFAVILRRLRGLAGFPLAARAVRFSHPAVKAPERYQAAFGVEPRFACEANDLVFGAGDLLRPATFTDPGLVAVLDRYAGEMLDRLPALGDLVGRIRAALMRALTSGSVSLEAIARSLHSSPRTLQRELGLRGTSYRELLEEVRRELALSLLKDQAMSVTEVAFLVGFANTASFHRVFKRWTGRTPEDFRSAPRRTS